MHRSQKLLRGISLVWLAMATLAPPSAGAQPVSETHEPICPPAQPVPEAVAQWGEKFLKPGETFSLDGMPPEVLKQFAAMQKEAAARQARDWPSLCRYADENAAVLNSGERPDVIFMGDSITENWKNGDASLFNATTLDRGISGQTTPQMLLRMYSDVINLRPRIVHIMAGTNDISGNTGPESDQTIIDNIRAMIVLAKANGIAVVLGNITPSTGFVLRPGFNPSARIIRVNAQLRQLATEQRVTFADYHAPMTDAAGGLRAGLANDGLHPNRDGYAVMRPITQRAIAQAKKHTGRG